MLDTDIDLNWAAFDAARGTHPRQKKAQQMTAQQQAVQNPVIPLSPAAMAQVKIIQKEAGLPQTGQLDPQTVAYVKKAYNYQVSGQAAADKKAKAAAKSAAAKSKAAAKRAAAKAKAAAKKKATAAKRAKAKAARLQKAAARKKLAQQKALAKAQAARAKAKAVPAAKGLTAPAPTNGKQAAAQALYNRTATGKTKSGKGFIMAKGRQEVNLAEEEQLNDEEPRSITRREREGTGGQEMTKTTDLAFKGKKAAPFVKGGGRKKSAPNDAHGNTKSMKVKRAQAKAKSMRAGGARPKGRTLDNAFDPAEKRGKDGRWMRLEGLMKATGGFTHDLASNSEPKSGFSVGIKSPDGKDWKELPHGKTSAADISKFADEHKDELSKPNRGIGGWANGDPKEGKVRDALDIVEVHHNIGDAADAADKAGQDGIFDLSNFEYISTKDAKKRAQVKPGDKVRTGKTTATVLSRDPGEHAPGQRGVTVRLANGNTSRRMESTLRTIDNAITPGGRVGDASPLGKGKRKLTDYEREIAHALIRKGKTKSQAIAIARGLTNKAAATGRWGDHGKASAPVRAGARASVAQRASLSNNSWTDADLATFDMADARGGTWKHGYIPTNAEAVLEKAHKAGSKGKSSKAAKVAKAGDKTRKLAGTDHTKFYKGKLDGLSDAALRRHAKSHNDAETRARTDASKTAHRREAESAQYELRRRAKVKAAKTAMVTPKSTGAGKSRKPRAPKKPPAGKAEKLHTGAEDLSHEQLVSEINKAKKAGDTDRLTSLKREVAHRVADQKATHAHLAKAQELIDTDWDGVKDDEAGRKKFFAKLITMLPSFKKKLTDVQSDKKALQKLRNKNAFKKTLEAWADELPRFVLNKVGGAILLSGALAVAPHIATLLGGG